MSPGKNGTTYRPLFTGHTVRLTKNKNLSTHCLGKQSNSRPDGIAVILKLTLRKEPSLSKRRNLTPNETLFCEISFKNIKPRHLSPKQQDILRSLNSYFSYDRMLSDKQLKNIKWLKHTADLAKRKEAIAKGRLQPSESQDQRISTKLITIYNPI